MNRPPANDVPQAAERHASPHVAPPPGVVRITVLFNNIPLVAGLTTGWGFSCLVEGLAKTLLFDTGADGGVLLQNMAQLGVDPACVEAVMISHMHADHAGGLRAFLEVHPDVDLWLPVDLPADVRNAMSHRGARVSTVHGAGWLADGIGSTGPLPGTMIEQALMLNVGERIVVITGCAHPGIERLARVAMGTADKPVGLLMGGFHLKGMSRSEIKGIIGRLQSAHVDKVAPSHCTGDTAIGLFRKAWAEDFVEGGLGAVIEVPLQ